MIKVLHCADLHLDSPFLGISHFSSEMASILRNSILRAFRRIIDIAIEREVDLVTVGGDVYDSSDHGLHSLVLFNDQIKRLSAAGIPCCIVTGNHDPLNKRRKGGNLPENCHLFGEKETVVHLENKDGVPLHVYGISYGNGAESRNLAKKLIKLYEVSKGISVALLHCNVGGTKEHKNYAPCTVEELKAAPFNAWLLGHVHEKRIVSIADPLILYPGNIQGRHIREVGNRGAYLIEFHRDDAPTTEFLPVSSVLWKAGETKIDNLDNLEDLVERMDEDFEKMIQSDEDAEAWVVRWQLIGQGTLETEFSLKGTSELFEEIQARWLDKSPIILIEKLTDNCNPTLDISEIRKQDSFLSMVVDAADQLQEQTGEANRIKEQILAEIDKPSFRKWIPDLKEKIINDPSFLDELIQKGMLHALNSMMEERRN